MIMFKHVLIFILLVIFGASCQDKQYTLKWEIPQYPPLIYKTEIKLIDSMSYLPEKYIMLKAIEPSGKMPGDTIIAATNMPGIQKKYRDWVNSYDYFSVFKKAYNEIEIEVIGIPQKEAQLKYFRSFFGVPQQKTIYNARIFGSGAMSTDYYDPRFTIMFGLPVNPIAIGDEWSVNLKFPIQAESEDEKTVNLVKFASVLTRGKELIAVLQYEIKSPQTVIDEVSSNAIHFRGVGYFNITKGKWEKFEAYYVTASTGNIVVKHAESIKLTEITLAEFNRYQAYQTIDDIKKVLGIAKPDSTKKTTATKQKKVVKPPKPKIYRPLTEIKCPITYTVQLLAAKQRVVFDSKKLSGFDYTVRERISDKYNDPYRYKYTVGNFCSVDKAKELRKKLIKVGFTDAFVITVVNK